MAHYTELSCHQQ